MANSDLTEKQRNFIETFITMPFLLGRDKARQDRAEWAAEFEQFNDHKQAVAARVNEIEDGNVRSALQDELALAQASLVQGEGKPDFDDARARVELVERAAVIQPEHAGCLVLIDDAAQKVETVLGYDPQNAAEITATLDLARDQARKGAAEHDMTSLAACKDTLGTLAGLTDQAEQDHAAIQTALGGLKDIGEDLARARPVLESDLGGALTPELGVQATGLGDIITSAAGGTRDEVETALKDAGAALAAFRQDGAKAVEDYQARLKALEDLTAAGEALAKARTDLAKPFGDTLPAPLETAAVKIATAIGAAKDGDAKTIGAAAASAGVEIGKLTTQAQALIRDRAAWVTAKQVYETLFQALSNHRNKGDATFVAGLYTALETDFAAACKKADEQFDYGGATQALAPLPDRCRKAISVADDVAEYEAVRADRDKRVRALPDAASVTEGAPRDKVVEVKKFYTDAVAEFEAGKVDKDAAHITTAVALLNKIPDGQQEALDLAKHAKAYEAAYSERQSEKTELSTWPDVYKDHLAAEITLFGTLIDAVSLPADKTIRTAPEYRAAAVKLANLSKFSPTLFKKMKLINAHYEEADKYIKRRDKIDAITVVDGRAAVEDYLAKIRADGNFAAARFNAKDYAGDIQALKSTEADLDGFVKLAGIAKDYLARKKTVDQKVAQIKSNGGPHAADAAASIESVVNSAKTEATAKHWQEALDLIKKAAERVGEAEKAGTAVKALGDVWENVETLGVDAAHAKFVLMHDKVKGDDPDNVVATPLAAEKTKADAALTAAKKGGDAGVASAAIAAALTEAYWLGQSLAHRAAYKVLYDVVKQAHEVELIKPEVNKDNIIQWYIDDIGNRKTDAKANADPPNLDFPEALKELAVAERQILFARQISKDWIKLRPTLIEIVDLAADLADPILDGNFANEKARLEKYNTDITEEIQQGKFEKIRALIKEGGAYAKNLTTIIQRYAKVKIALQNQFPPLRAKITEAAAPHAKDARAQVAIYDQEVTDLLAAHASQAAWNVLGKLLKALNDGAALNKLAEQYFALKTTCADTLRDYSNKNSTANARVSERLEELYEHFELGSVFDEPGDLTSDVSTWEARQNFDGGIKRLKPIPGECAKLDADIQAYDTCKTERDKAGEEIGKVLKQATGDIAPIAARLRGKHQNAVSIMDGGNYAAARAMFQELLGDAAKAAESATQIGALQKEITDITQSVDDDQLDAKVTAAGDQIAKIRLMGHSAVADPELLAAEKAIGEAREALGKDAGKVRDAVTAALKEAADAMQRIELYRQIDAAAGYARAQLVKLGEHDEKKFIQTDIAEQTKDIETHMAKARDRSSTIAMVMNEIEQVMAALQKIRGIADNYHEFVGLRTRAVNDLATLEKMETRYAVRDAIPEIRAHIAQGTDQAQKREHLDAVAALRRAQTALSAATLEAKLEKGEVPSDDEIAAILGSPAGDKKLDRIVAGLDAKAQRGVLVAVMKVRFGCDVELLKKSPETVDADYRKWLIETNATPEADRLVELVRLTDETGGPAKAQYETWLSANADKTDANKLAKLKELVKSTGDRANARFDDWLADTNAKSDVDKASKKKQMHDDNVEDAMDETGPNLMKLYQVMTDCPNSDTLDNDSMLVLSASGGDATGSSYSAGLDLDAGTGTVSVTKKVVMREGDVGNSGFYGIALPFELDEIDDDCKPVDADPLSYFSWNTLHEVGHAVDDKLGAMKKDGNAKAGWQEHGANVLPIAREAAKSANYDYDENYITAYLSGVSDPPIPEAPDPDKAEEWERKRRAVCNWIDTIRVTKKPWSSAAIAKSSALANGRVYQESYPNDWTSYDLAERKKGVSGYQFRAPGEWFSELYAAYHSGKMNSGHPHRKWISNI